MTPRSATAPLAAAVAASRSASDRRTPETLRSSARTDAAGGTGLTGRRQASSQAPGSSQGGGEAGPGSPVPSAVTDKAAAVPDASAPSTEAPSTRLEAPSVELPAVTLPQRTVEATAPTLPAAEVPQSVPDVQNTLDDVTTGATQQVKDTTGAAGVQLP
jgi:hypothetical protein